MRSVISPCLPSFPSLRNIYIFKQTVKAQKHTICYPPEFAWLKILCISSAYKSISLSSEMTAFPCSPPLFFTELSDDKVNTRVISLVTALNLSILEGYTLASRLMLLLRLNRQNQSFSNTPILASLNKQPIQSFTSD